MQFFRGRPLRTLEPGSTLAKHAGEEIVHASCKQVFLDGFFHGDPHAGNILVDDESNVRMLDLGLVGRLSQAERDEFVTLVLALIANDSGTIRAHPRAIEFIETWSLRDMELAFAFRLQAGDGRAGREDCTKVYSER